MSDDSSEIGGISDVGNLSEEQDELMDTTRSPPSKSNLEREANKLRSKFKILREALAEEKMTDINQEIQKVEKGNHPAFGKELQELERRRAERTTIAHGRKRVKVENIVNDYKSKVQAFDDEKRVHLLTATDKGEFCRTLPGWGGILVTGVRVANGSELINVLVPGSIPTRLIRDCSDERKRYFLMLENQTLVLKAAKRLHCSLVNIAASDLVEGKVIKNGMVIKLATEYPKSSSQANASSEIKSTNELSAEHALLRWINSTLNTPNDLVTDFKDCLKDGRQYGRLLNTLFPTIGDIDEFIAQNPFQRAPLIVSMGKSILGNKCILEVNDILKGNETMNVLFLATLCRHVAEKMCQTSSISCQSSSDELVPAKSTAELESKIATLMEENAALRQKIIDMQTALEDSDEVPLETIKLCHEEQTEKVLEDYDELTRSDCIEDYDEETRNDLTEDYGESLCNAYIDDSVALRHIYLRSKDLLFLVTLLYPDHSAPSLTSSCTISGHLTKKTVWGSRWNTRYTIIKDNFMLFYKDERAAEPTSVEKLDDCLVKRMDGICARFKDPVLCVEICSRVNPHYFYISSNESVLDSWKDQIIRVSSWWVSRP